MYGSKPAVRIKPFLNSVYLSLEKVKDFQDLMVKTRKLETRTKKIFLFVLFSRI